MKKRLLASAATIMLLSAYVHGQTMPVNDETPVFITIGQSNADGSAYFNATEDARLNAWYSSDQNPQLMKIWYRSCKIQNQTNNGLGEAARWCIDDTEDVAPGWLNLWYRNENTSGRTAMNMIHSFGTSSTGTGTNCAQGRRGMEGQFGMRYQTQYPDKELYIVKLGCSGSFISSWAHSSDNTNWNYFYTNMFKPAMEQLLAEGKKPRLAGIWWMQGCADNAKSKDYYLEHLKELIAKCRTDLGFPEAKIYIGHIVKPGDCAASPNASTQYGDGVRQAQDAVTDRMSTDYIEGTQIIDGSDLSFQDDNLHFDHVGINGIGDKIADAVIADGFDNWASFTTPGNWSATDDGAVFTPLFGNPTITYETTPLQVTATLQYNGWSETKTYNRSESADNGIFVSTDGDGDGSSWQSALNSLSDAVSKAAQSSRPCVYVAQGSYSLTSTLTVPAGVTIIGGYNTSTGEKSTDPELTTVTISGNGNVMNLATGTTTAYARIENLKIHGASNGRGITANDYSQVYNCIIAGNTTGGTSYGTSDGAGISLKNNTVLANSIIKDNTTTNYIGAAIAIDGNNSTVKNCLITGNTTNGNFNTSINAGAAIVHWSGKTGNKLINCTVTGNNGASYGALWGNGSNSTCEYINCVFYGNKVNGSTSPDKEFGILAAHTMTNCASTQNGAGIVLTASPFNNEDSSDYTLSASCPLIDAGNDSAYGNDLNTDTDLAGNTRRMGESIDVGAYEANPTDNIFTVTIDTPQHATITVAYGETTTTSTTRIQGPTELTVTVEPEYGYKTTSLTIDGQEVSFADNTYSFTLTADCTVSAAVERDPSIKTDYCKVDGNSNHSERYLRSLTISDDKGNSATVSPIQSGTRQSVYNDKTTTVFTTEPGATLTITTSGNGVWMQSYAYVDWDNSGDFTATVESNGIPSEGSELVSFNGYRVNGDGSGTAYNSHGDVVSTLNTSISTTMPTFVIPADMPAGEYRIRHKIDWDCIDPCGNSASNNLIANNGGCITDFILKINAQTHVLTVVCNPDDVFYTLSDETNEEVTDLTAIEAGTKLNLTAGINDGRDIKVTLDDEELTMTDNVYSFEMPDADATLTIEAIDAAAEYCIAEGNVSRTERYVTTLNISDNNSNSLDVEGYPDSSTRPIYKDCTSSVFTTVPGAEVTVNVTAGGGEWMHSYVYVDYNRNGEFEYDINTDRADNELVAFNCYGAGQNIGDDASTWYNSLGEILSTASGHRYIVDGGIPAFTIPADLADGDYRIRFKTDWNDANPCGRTTGKNLSSANGAVMMDFTIRIDAAAAIDGIATDTDAPATYYNLQGIKVSADNLTPGFYIVRQGDKVSKVLIRK